MAFTTPWRHPGESLGIGAGSGVGVGSGVGTGSGSVETLNGSKRSIFLLTVVPSSWGVWGYSDDGNNFRKLAWNSL